MTTTFSLMIRTGVATAGVSLLAGAFMAGRMSLRSTLAGIRRAARTDPLTGVANRAGLQADLAGRVDGRKPWSLVLVDLDGFKQVNDCHGHGVGDEVLVKVARRLSAVAEPGRDLVGRLGGDEFVIAAAGDQGDVIARHVGVVLHHPIAVGALRLSVTASVGVVAAVPGDDVRAVLHSADLALYGAKRAGGAQVVEFDPTTELAKVLVERPALRTRNLTIVAGVR